MVPIARSFRRKCGRCAFTKIAGVLSLRCEGGWQRVVLVQGVGRVSHVIFTQKGGITGESMLALRCCRIHYRCWRHQLFIKGGALGRLKTYMLTSLICFHLPPTQRFPLFQEKRLCAHPFLEIYRDGQIHFMAPLARQGDFYVPEVRRVERRPPVKDGLQSDSEISGITFMLLSTIKSILLTRSTSENYQWNYLRMVHLKPQKQYCINNNYLLPYYWMTKAHSHSEHLFHHHWSKFNCNSDCLLLMPAKWTGQLLSC